MQLHLGDHVGGRRAAAGTRPNALAPAAAAVVPQRPVGEIAYDPRKPAPQSAPQARRIAQRRQKRFLRDIVGLVGVEDQLVCQRPHESALRSEFLRVETVVRIPHRRLPGSHGRRFVSAAVFCAPSDPELAAHNGEVDPAPSNGCRGIPGDDRSIIRNFSAHRWGATQQPSAGLSRIETASASVMLRYLNASPPCAAANPRRLRPPPA